MLVAIGLAAIGVQQGMVARRAAPDAARAVGPARISQAREGYRVTVRGTVDPDSLSAPVFEGVFLFKLEEYGAALVLLTTGSRTRAMLDPALFEGISVLGAPLPTHRARSTATLAPATVRFFSEPQTFTGVIALPATDRFPRDIGVDRGDVTYAGDEVGIRGVFSGYCVRRPCTGAPRVLLVDEHPPSRALGYLLALVGISSAAALAFVALRSRKTGS